MEWLLLHFFLLSKYHTFLEASSNLAPTGKGTLGKVIIGFPDHCHHSSQRDSYKSNYVIFHPQTLQCFLLPSDQKLKSVR